MTTAALAVGLAAVLLAEVTAGQQPTSDAAVWASLLESHRAVEHATDMQPAPPSPATLSLWLEQHRRIEHRLELGAEAAG